VNHGSSKDAARFHTAWGKSGHAGRVHLITEHAGTMKVRSDQKLLVMRD